MDSPKCRPKHRRRIPKGRKLFPVPEAAPSCGRLHYKAMDSPKCRPKHRRRIPKGRKLFPVPEAAPGALERAKEKWDEDETKALLEFILFHEADPSQWPTHPNTSMFWKEAAKFVQQRSNSPVLRNPSSCRLKVTAYFRKKFSSPVAAEKYYWGMDVPVEPVIRPNLVKESVESLEKIPVDQQLQVVSTIFHQVAESGYGVQISSDFLPLVLRASKHLKDCGRSNILYGLATAIGTLRIDGSDSRLPAKRMPMGLLEYTVNFFNANSFRDSQIGMVPADYKQWLITMYSQFGNKWANLHLGPMWGAATVEYETNTGQENTSDTMMAKVNIPGVSTRSIRKYIAVGSVTTTSEIQFHVLDEAAKHQPSTWWWIKADGCDLVSGLAESMRNIWSGDVDLNDGQLEKQYKLYRDRLESVTNLKLVSREDLQSKLILHLTSLNDDLEFLNKALQSAQAIYEEKVQSQTSADKVMFKLAWTVRELEELVKQMGKITADICSLLQSLQDTQYDLQLHNVARRLTTIREMLLNAVKKLSKHQRQAASHIFVFMISSETRSVTPYALPVQCLPICGLKDKQARELCNHLIAAMLERDMKVAGFTTNGEFNSLRWKGNQRPLTVLQLKSEARAAYQSKGLRRLLDMLTPTVCDDGKIVAKVNNPAVTNDLLESIHAWMREGATMTDVVIRLREKTVPDKFTYHSWSPGKKETLLEMLRSILAQLHYRHKVLEWEEKGVPFRTHLYVPENHPLTGLPFHEREDETHVFKRIGQSLRAGGPRKLKLERFMEAVYDPEAKLSYHALIGTRKQCVSDVEQIFSTSVLQFFEKKGYTAEADYVRVIGNWRRACDERGLTNFQRSQYNQDFLSYILDELMPWHDREDLDLSQLEVNQPISGVRGFTRETLSALVVDIESREWRRQFNVANQILPEHPRSSTTDDVECFFSVLRDMVGKDFTHKEVMVEWRKACQELTKRMDPDLLFYYHTSTHRRFYEGELPSFSAVPKKKREKRVARRELLTNTIGGRATLAQHGATSIRTKYHNVPVELPPPPSCPVHVAEHSYS